MGLGGLSVQDSELVSQAFAQCAITNNPKVWLAVRPAGNPWLLVARRYGRRFYLPLLAVIIVCLSLSMAPTWPQVAVVVFLLAWSILGAGVARCARFGMWGSPGTARMLWAVVAGHALVAAMILWAAWQAVAPASLVVTVTMVVYMGVVRSRPRAAISAEVVDSGLGAMVSPDVIGYYSKGLMVALVGAVIVLAAISGS